MKFWILLIWFLTFPAKAEHGLSLYGMPSYPANFKHFDYVNPNAPKEGILKASSPHGFDTLNPFSIDGIAPAGIQLMHDTLMKTNGNEPFAQYGLIAQDVKLSHNRKNVTFSLNPKAKFSDNTPITAHDVLFSFEILREKGLPYYRFYFQDVESVKVLNDWQICFVLKNNQNRELPLILGQLPVLSKKYWENKDFTKANRTRP